MFFVRGDGMAEIGCGCRGGVAIVLFMDEGICVNVQQWLKISLVIYFREKRKVTDLHFALPFFYFGSDFLILKKYLLLPCHDRTSPTH